MVARPKQAAGEGGRVDPPVAGLPLHGVAGQFGEGDRGVVAVQLEGGPGDPHPLAGPFGTLLAMGGRVEEPAQAGVAGGQQRVGSA
jgi:hypothetical protein